MNWARRVGIAGAGGFRLCGGDQGAGAPLAAMGRVEDPGRPLETFGSALYLFLLGRCGRGRRLGSALRFDEAGVLCGVGRRPRAIEEHQCRVIGGGNRRFPPRSAAEHDS